MLRHPLTLRDGLAIVRRRSAVLVLCALLIPVVVFVASLAVPNRYTSKTVVLVEQSKVPDTYVKPILTEELNQRLQTMREQILSRTRLEAMIEELGLFKDDRPRVPMEVLVERVRKGTEIAVIRPEGGAGIPGFSVSFSASDPHIAQRVCNQITSLFTRENLRAREQLAQGTTDFFSKQLAEAKNRLDEQDAKFAALKRRYYGQLPGQEQNNASFLSAANSQLDAVTQTLSRAQQDRTYTESLLSERLAAWRAVHATSSSPENLQQQLDRAQTQLVAAQGRYTDDHPDVVRLRNEVQRLQQRIENSEKMASVDEKPSSGGGESVFEPKEAKQLRAALGQLDTTIMQKRKEQAALQTQVRTLQARLQVSPAIEEEYKNVSRDYQAALQMYNDLLAKRTQSEMATELEHHQEGDQFRVMDPANLPERPTWPKRVQWTGFAFGAGVALGLALAFLLEWRDSSLHNQEDVEFYLKLPTLASMPRF